MASWMHDEFFGFPWGGEGFALDVDKCACVVFTDDHQQWLGAPTVAVSSNSGCVNPNVIASSQSQIC